LSDRRGWVGAPGVRRTARFFLAVTVMTVEAPQMMKVMTVSPLPLTLLPQGGEGSFVSRLRDFHIKLSLQSAVELC